MGDALRVTVVATGLGKPQPARSGKPVLEVIDTSDFMSARTGTDDASGFMPPMDNGETPAVFGSGRSGRGGPRPVLTEQNLEQYDIPAFLRRQAD